MAIRLTPQASADGIHGVMTQADGGAALKVSVTAVPEDGKANARLIGLLSKALKVPKADIVIERGTTSRHKLLFIRGDAEELGRRIEIIARES